ncbi:MAG: hypothetical protein H6585_11795 [Flavobacteriales bacterium]|nr:hypothetical protein [Flavobacteriales bacterium]MCB9449012.1 hypothetical protein [Flavobacteriales bacterium]
MTKRKIQINRPDLSREDATKDMNFSKVMKSYKALRPFYKTWQFMAGGTALVVAMLALTQLPVKQKEDAQVRTEATSAVSANDSMNAVAATEVTPGKKPFVNPPFPDYDIPYQKFNVMADKACKLTYSKTGSEIIIPAGAFVDEKGTPVQDNVVLEYREMHDVVDFFVSGIPMTYDTLGETRHFESAGMLEVRGWQNNKPVYLAPGKEMKVLMASRDDREIFNRYHLDTVAKKWVCDGKSKVIPCEKKVEQPAKVEEKSRPVVKELFRAEAEEVPVGSPLPVYPQAANPSQQRFKVDVDPTAYPELACYKGLSFEVSARDRSFDKKWFGVNWTGMELQRSDPSSNLYNLALSRPDTSVHVLVKPVVDAEHLDEAMATYTKLKTERMKDVQGDGKQVKTFNEAQESSRPEIAVADRVMEMGYKVAGVRPIAIPQMGIHNCDFPAPLPRFPEVRVKSNACTVAAAYKDADGGGALKKGNVFLASTEKNQLIDYGSGNVIVFRRDADNMLWTITGDGKLAIYSPEEFKTVEKGARNHTFVLTKYESIRDGLDKLREMIAE